MTRTDYIHTSFHYSISIENRSYEYETAHITIIVIASNYMVFIIFQQ